MKAYNRLRPAAIAALAACIALAGSCSEQPPAPMPAPMPRPTPSPAPAPPAPLAKPDTDWRTAPITPGDWQWSEQGARSVAQFAGGRLVLTCDRAAATVTLARSGAAAGPVAMTIVTSSLERPVTGDPQPGPPPAIAVSLGAQDPVLDALAFSRGRFAVETAGLETLFVPSWPEVSRVVEDCR